MCVVQTVQNLNLRRALATAELSLKQPTLAKQRQVKFMPTESSLTLLGQVLSSMTSVWSLHDHLQAKIGAHHATELHM